MKNKLIILLAFFFSIFLVGCNNNISTKTEFNINEKAIIDDIEITLLSRTYEESSNILELNFLIKNVSSKNIVLVSDTNFKLYDSNQKQQLNTYNSKIVNLGKKEETTYKLQYYIEDNNINYILFYSGIVENNIRFDF